MTKNTKEHKLSFFFVAFIIAFIIIGSSFALAQYQNKVLMTEFESRAKTISELIMLYREWLMEQEGIYIRESNSKIVSKEKEFYKKVSPNILHELSDNLTQKQIDYSFETVAVNSENKFNLPLSQKKNELHNFKDKKNPLTEIVKEDEKYNYYYVSPLIFKKECLACHASKGVKEDDLGGLVVKLDITEYMSHILRNYFTNILIGVLSATIIICLVYRVIYLKVEETLEGYKNLAQLDGLTGIYNHSTFMSRLDFLLNKKAESFGLLLFDIDDFKKVNDTYGHQAGDFILKGIAKVIENEIRQQDTLARYGGEEFGIIINAPRDKVYQVAERIRKKIASKSFSFTEYSIKATISIGIAVFPSDATEKSDLIKCADDYLYLAKKSGKNRIGNEK